MIFESFGSILDCFRFILGIILDVFGDHFEILLEEFWKYFASNLEHLGVIFESFWGHFERTKCILKMLLASSTFNLSDLSMQVIWGL